jgi:hypothetical protein
MFGDKTSAIGVEPMAQCPPELLDDLGTLFATWPGVIEKRPLEGKA